MKKWISLLLCSILLFSIAQADSLDIISEKNLQVYTGFGYTLEKADAFPEKPGEGQTEYIVKAALKASNPNIDASISLAYDAHDGAWIERGTALQFLYKEPAGRESYVQALQTLLNQSFENAEQNEFYNAALAYCVAHFDNLNEAGAKNLLNQILVQHEIFNFHKDSTMQNYAAQKAGADNYDTTADAKNPIYNGRKFMLTVQDNGYVLSDRPTNEQSNIEITTTTAAERVIHKQFAWDAMLQLLTEALPNSQAKNNMLGISKNSLQDGKAQVFITGTGLLLAVDQTHVAFMPQNSDVNTVLQTLKTVVQHFPTLNSYAKTAGSEGLQVHAYFENGETVYTEENITALADIVTGAMGEPVLLGEDTAQAPTEQNAGPILFTLEESSETGKTAETLAEQTSESSEEASEKEPNAATQTSEETPAEEILGEAVEATPLPVVSEGQVKVLNRRVNVRETPQGKVLFRVVRGNVLNIVGDSQELKGQIWYFIEHKGKKGYIRGDVVKLLEATPSTTPEVENTEEVEDTEDTSGEDSTEAAEPNNNVYQSLGRGSKGQAVQALQERLVELGYLKSADGKFGGKTEAAVKLAQAAFHQQQSGKADEAFQNILFSENAVDAKQAEILAKEPNNIQLNLEALQNAEKHMRSRFAKTDKGYTTGISLQNDGTRYSLNATAVDNNASNYEIFIAASQMQGAVNINPQFEIRIINPNLQDVQTVQLVRGNKVTQLDSALWVVERGVVRISLTHNLTALNQMIENKGEIVLLGAEQEYRISMNPTQGPYLVSRYMRDVWKNIDGAFIAEAASYGQEGIAAPATEATAPQVTDEAKQETTPTENEIDISTVTETP